PPRGPGGGRGTGPAVEPSGAAAAGREDTMKLNTPRWWYVREGAPSPVARALLKPLSWLWAGATARRIARTVPEDAGVAVISVGNLTVGGSGKTPVAREV